eukprot:4945501-Pyramimonas_sp.AAC.1
MALRRRCICDAVRCGARFAPRWRRRCITDVADASPMRRRFIADVSAKRRDPPTPSTPTPSRRPL